MADGGGRPPRWDPDDRGIGVGDARSFAAVLDALRGQSEVPGWAAEDPEVHLLPHLSEAIDGGAPWRLGATGTNADGTLAIRLRWTGPPDADRHAIRAAAFGLIGQIAEGASLVHERRDEGALSYAVVTGDLPGETRFATHGHTLILTVDDADGPPSPAADG